MTVVAMCVGMLYAGSGDAAGTGAAPGIGKVSSPVDSVATVPGRPVTNHQAARAEEKRKEERQQLAERLREAESRQEEAEKKRAEEALLRPAGSEAGARTRPIIGRDGRNRSSAQTASV